MVHLCTSYQKMNTDRFTFNIYIVHLKQKSQYNCTTRMTNWFWTGGGGVASFNASRKIYPVILRIFAVWFTTPPVYYESSHWALRKTAGFFVPVILVCIYISFYIRQNALNITASSLPFKMKRNRFTYHMHPSSSLTKKRSLTMLTLLCIKYDK